MDTGTLEEFITRAAALALALERFTAFVEKVYPVLRHTLPSLVADTPLARRRRAVVYRPVPNIPWDEVPPPAPASPEPDPSGNT